MLKIIIGLALFYTITACTTSNPDAVLSQVFNEKEIVLVNEIINYYDNYVLSKTDQSMPIKDAYLEFMTKNASLVMTREDMLVPLREERIAFFDTLDKDVLSNIFYMRDTFYLYSPDKFVEAVYHPYMFQLKPPKYLNLMEILSKRNDFYLSYYDRIESVGDISPGVYSLILASYYKDNPDRTQYSETFNFSKKEDRFAFIVPFLFIDDKVIPKGMYATDRERDL